MRILIVDDHEVVREGLRQVLSEAGIGPVDEAGGVKEAVDRVRARTYDAILLDMSLVDGTGFEALREIRSLRPRAPVLVISMHPEQTWALRAIRQGANGYLSKSTSSREIVSAVRQVVAGGRYLSSQLESLLEGTEPADGPDSEREETLSKRESEVLRLLGSGRPVGDVARVLGLSVKTVSTHREHILRKMGFSNNMELIRHCLLHGLLDEAPRNPGNTS